MKKALITLLAVLVTASASFAQGYHYVSPHFRSNGSSVGGHYQTNPDRNFYNNWSTQGNQNPFTGDFGHRTTPNHNGSNRGGYFRL